MFLPTRGQRKSTIGGNIATNAGGPHAFPVRGDRGPGDRYRGGRATGRGPFLRRAAENAGPT